MFKRSKMIYIERGEINDVCLTLNEKTTISPVYYLMEIYSNQNHSSKVLYLGTDNSSNPNRWNEFEVEENDIEDLANGIVSLISGTYDYYVFESTSSNIDKSGVVSLVESGKLTVPGEGLNLTTYDDPLDEYTFT